MAGCGCGGAPRTTVIEMLQSTPLYAYLNDQEMSIVADAFVSTRVAAGKPLPNSPLYIVVSGEVEVRRQTMKLCTKRAGAFFSRTEGVVDVSDPMAVRRSLMKGRNSIADPSGGVRKRMSIMMSREKVRRTSTSNAEESETVPTDVVATIASELLLILDDRLASLKASDPEIAAVISTMSHANVERYLSKVPFIQRARLSAQQLRTVGELGSYITRDAGQVLFSQGDAADAFYVLLKGAVEVWVDRSKGTSSSSGIGAAPAPAPPAAPAAQAGSESPTMQRVASTLSPGDHIGESALVVEGDRSATIRVTARSIFFALEKHNFGALMQVAPSLEAGIMLHTKERLMQVYRQLRIPFFAELTDKKIKSAAEHSLLEHWNVRRPSALCLSVGSYPRSCCVRGTREQAGDVVCHKGDDGKAFYVVVSGGVSVAEAILAPGNYFGEISMLMSEQPVTATCTAKARSTLLALPRDGFHALFADEPELAAYMRIKSKRPSPYRHPAHTTSSPRYYR